jgi:molecular chaperone DnaK (HSP70)
MSFFRSSAAESTPAPTIAPRYAVGIDLGTTNCCLAYAALDRATAPVRVLRVPQLIHPGEVETRPLLPSFLYQVATAEMRAGAWRLPWERQDRATVSGAIARQRAGESPGRVVASAKSWLAHGGVDREGAILPWEAPDGVPKISPVAAAAVYLGHLRAAWNAAFAAEDERLRLEHQALVLTVPASFDAVARELTVRAAARVGLRELTLLEEPQAALYAWIAGRGEGWRQELRVGDRLLVVDVGGGTTDLSLIEAVEEEGELLLRRVAVGDHILLGGDNMDLALAHAAAARLGSDGGRRGRLDRLQMEQLVHACRRAKEVLLEQSEAEAEAQPLTVVGRGSSLIAATLRTELTREETERLLVDGFFPRCERGARPEGRRTGLREVGLPYAADAGITRHLAAFLDRNAGFQPNRVLFNGGVMKARRLRERVLEVLEEWGREQGAGATGRGAARILAGADLDLAVARGAAYYARARRGEGVRIRGGTARSHYVGVEAARPAVPGVPTPLMALCVAPQGMEEGTEAAIEEREFAVAVGERVEFRFFASAVRAEDRVGELVEYWGDQEDELRELSPVVTLLRAPEAGVGSNGGAGGDDGSDAASGGRLIPVQLHSRVTAVGTLEIFLQGRGLGERWRLEFDVKEGSEA